MTPAAFAREARRLLRALHPEAAGDQLAIEIKSRIVQIEAKKGEPRATPRESWSASAWSTRADGATAEDAMASVLAQLTSQLQARIADRRAELERLERAQKSTLRIVADSAEDATGGAA